MTALPGPISRRRGDHTLATLSEHAVSSSSRAVTLPCRARRLLPQTAASTTCHRALSRAA
eukprot:7382996-Prymnesium_polylepis.1